MQATDADVESQNIKDTIREVLEKMGRRKIEKIMAATNQYFSERRKAGRDCDEPTIVEGKDESTV